MSDYNDFALMMYVQKRKIETDRYDEGTRIGHDPREDNDYDLSWTTKSARGFRLKWEKCLCRSCAKARECGFKLAKECPYHWPVKKISKKFIEIEIKK